MSPQTGFAAFSAGPAPQRAEIAHASDVATGSQAGVPVTPLLLNSVGLPRSTTPERRLRFVRATADAAAGQPTADFTQPICYHGD